MLSILDFITVSKYHGSEKCEKTSHATTNHLAIYMHIYIEMGIAMHSIIQLKLYRAAIL